MTGTSLDAVDMAILETDGETITAFGPAGERKLSEATRDLCVKATSEALMWARLAEETPAPAIFLETARQVADEHFAAADGFMREHRLEWRDLDLIGMHGQTVFHERPANGRIGRTVQLGDALRLARATGVRVAYDFRTADVEAGGEGAPLAPIYHLARARASSLEPPLAVLNLGGVGNITMWLGGDELGAFDTGPGNGMIDQVMQARGAGRFDEGGRLARSGRVDADVLAAYLAHPYFAAPPPKSLDRYDFPIERLDRLSMEDAAATLVAFTAESVRLGFERAAGGKAPRDLVVCGGGRHNPEIMRVLRERMPAGVAVRTAEEVGWRGDAIEAEAFAFLAARTARGLPISFPGTTGAKTPLKGGTIVVP
jgi:anhydro-N-acetylmuramic acid kinase